MSYTSTLVATLSPVPRPRVVNKQRNTISFTHLPTPSPSPFPTQLGLRAKDYDFPYGAVLMILSLLYILARINKKTPQKSDTNYTGIQIHQTYTLDPVRRRR
jgi:hypothetical protein